MGGGEPSVSDRTTNMFKKLDVCCKELTMWSRVHFSNNKIKIGELQERLRVIQEGTDNMDVLNDEREVKELLASVWKREEMYWH